MFAIIRTRWQTRPLSPRAKRRSSAAPGSLRKKYAGIAYPPNMVRLPNHSTTSGDPRKPVLHICPHPVEAKLIAFGRRAFGRRDVICERGAAAVGLREILGSLDRRPHGEAGPFFP